MVCLCHALLLFSMHYGILGCEFSKFSRLKSNLHVSLIVWLVFALLCCFFQCTVWITRVWVQWIFVFFSQTCMYMSYWYCGLSFPCSIAHFNTLWNNRMWVQWIFLFQVRPARLVDFWFVFDVLHVLFQCFLAGEFCEFFSLISPTCVSHWFCRLSFPCSVAYFNALRITKRWVQQFFML